MRTNIEIDDELMAKALLAGPYKTKREAVEEGLKLLARQAAYREILKWKGKLKWEGEPWVERDRQSPPSVEDGATDGAASKVEAPPAVAVPARKRVKSVHARR